jgi:hypothetical protein
MIAGSAYGFWIAGLHGGRGRRLLYLLPAPLFAFAHLDREQWLLLNLACGTLFLVLAIVEIRAAMSQARASRSDTTAVT